MNNKRLRKFSLLNIICGYLAAFLFILLVFLNRPAEEVIQPIQIAEEELFNGLVKEEETKVVYVPTPTTVHREVGIDYGRGVVLDDRPDVVIRDTGGIALGERVGLVQTDHPNHIIVDETLDRVVHRGGNLNNERIFYEDRDTVGVVRDGHGGVRSVNDRAHGISKGVGRDRLDGEVDRGLLDRRLAALDKEVGVVDVDALHTAIREKEGLEIEDGLNMSQLTLARDNEAELGDFDTNFKNDDAGNGGYGATKGGELFAYNTPSLGVGAGIGTPAIGAGAGAAGLGAGIGEAVLDGKTVPTLGGIGTGPPPLGGEVPGSPSSGGVGGLSCGAGAGGAAGLTQGYVTEKLGLGIGVGKGCAEHGGDCDGHHGHGAHDYDHLPKDGVLHIMMHVDGSGSILHTRKQLDIMKDTLLKEALLPYYNNDPELYNRRVTIVDGSGERTLRFFTEAAKKDNVLAVVFQDEAQPAYHLPNFNRKPEADYLDDLKALKSELGDHAGIYRGIMFQVNRGRTFAKSFKEFVENTFQGTGYLADANLKKYHWEDNRHHIKNKDGIIFSDEYHAQDKGEPQYYLDLLFNASRKVGLDLNIYKGGLTDGKYIKTQQ